MLHRLEENDYEIVRPLFDDLSYNLVIDSVLDGNTPAWIYVDDPTAPQTALLWDLQDAMHLAGEWNNEAVNRALADLLQETIVPHAKRWHIPYLSIHYSPEQWERRMDLLLEGLGAERAGRRYYTFDRRRVDWRERMPEGFSMNRIDENFREEYEDVKNADHVYGWVRSFWRSLADFAETGIGYFLTDDDAICSWCLSVFVSGDRFELGLATAEPYRRRGFATLVSDACLEYCVENGIEPTWHCWEDNEPSARLADKLGFSLEKKYTVYRFWLVER